jgi:hypothetical protein
MMIESVSNTSPSAHLYNHVRVSFIKQDSTVGLWNDLNGQKRRQQLIEASGITHNPISNAADHTTPAAAAITTPEAFAYWGC